MDYHRIARQGADLGAPEDFDPAGFNSEDFDWLRVMTRGHRPGRIVLVSRTGRGAESLRIGRIRRILEILDGDCDPVLAGRLELAGRGNRGLEPLVLRLAVRILRAPADEQAAWLAAGETTFRRDLRARGINPAGTGMTVPRMWNSVQIVRRLREQPALIGWQLEEAQRSRPDG